MNPNGPYRKPTPMEINALMQVKRMVHGLNSTVNCALLWDPARKTYVIGVEYDYRIAYRLPVEYFGVLVKQYARIPLGVTKDGRFPGATIAYGPSRLSLTDGYGIGWPVIDIQGGGTEYNTWDYCNPPEYFRGDPGASMPPPGGYYYGCGCGE